MWTFKTVVYWWMIVYKICDWSFMINITILSHVCPGWPWPWRVPCTWPTSPWITRHVTSPSIAVSRQGAGLLHHNRLSSTESWPYTKFISFCECTESYARSTWIFLTDSYDVDDLVLEWITDRPIHVEPHIELPQFTLNHVSHTTCQDRVHLTGNSCTSQVTHAPHR